MKTEAVALYRAVLRMRSYITVQSVLVPRGAQLDKKVYEENKQKRSTARLEKCLKNKGELIQTTVDLN